MDDIMDGNLWQDYVKESKLDPGDLVLLLNFDGFSLWKGSKEVSMQPLLVMLGNLQPNLRIKTEYINVWGLVPQKVGGKGMNLCLMPIVAEINLNNT
jgi:hypothetical protein